MPVPDGVYASARGYAGGSRGARKNRAGESREIIHE
ncbi:hypothetical protein SUDANB60_00702 [Streptomyces sp. enrichment culture]